MKFIKKDFINLAIIFLFTLIVFSGFLCGHYAGDTYYIMEVGYKDYAMNRSLNDGRVFMCLINLFADFVHMPIQVFVILTLFFALLISCISVILLKNIILRYKPTENKYLKALALIISYFTIFNFMYVENMYFVECIVMAFCMLFHIISADILVARKKHYLFKSMIFSILAIFMYQGMVGLFLSLVLIFSIIKSDNKLKDYMRNLFLSGFIVGIRNFIKFGFCKYCW